MIGIAGRAASPPPPSRRLGAFTMIEVLLVMFILALVAALVVSVSGYVMRSSGERETTSIQRVLLEAIQAYHDAIGSRAYPPDSYTTGGLPTSTSGRVLINYLTGRVDPEGDGTFDPNSMWQAPPAKAGMEVLLKLPRDAWDGNWNSPVNDGWGRAMRYEVSGGLGGSPVVISAGPDGRFGKNDGPGIPDDPTKAEDNIRSDESQ